MFANATSQLVKVKTTKHYHPEMLCRKHGCTGRQNSRKSPSSIRDV